MHVLRAGRALLLSDPSVPSPHLWFTVTDPEPTIGKFVAVLLVTARAHTDRTVALGPGDHPFITHASHVDFGAARFMLRAKVQARLADGRCRLEADTSPDLLVRIQAGLFASPRTIHAVANYCRERLGWGSVPP